MGGLGGIVSYLSGNPSCNKTRGSSTGHFRGAQERQSRRWLLRRVALYVLRACKFILDPTDALLLLAVILLRRAFRPLTKESLEIGFMPDHLPQVRDLQSESWGQSSGGLSRSNAR